MPPPMSRNTFIQSENDMTCSENFAIPPQNFEFVLKTQVLGILELGLMKVFFTPKTIYKGRGPNRQYSKTLIFPEI